MQTRDLTFSGGFILGAGLAYASGRAKAGMNPGLQCIAGALGVAAVAYGAKLIAKYGRRYPSTSTAFDVDVPNYAWLR